MKYVGSKNRLSKQIAPIIQSYITEDTTMYIEPFVGGANMIDKIKSPVKIGTDVHEKLIALLVYVQDEDNISNLPSTITEDEYINVRDNKNSYPDWYVGLVGFCATFGAKYFGGFARDRKGKRDMSSEGIRNIINQAPNLKGIKFGLGSYKDYDPKTVSGAVIYCDPPYKSTLGYRDTFSHNEFYEWCVQMAENNTVLISEYDMPEDIFEEFWCKEVTIGVSSINNSNRGRTERLYKVIH
jgi:site-specific DNA-adenine methylase